MGLRVFYKLLSDDNDRGTIEKRQVNKEEGVISVDGNEGPIISTIKDFEISFDKEILSVKASILLLESIDFNITLKNNETWGDYCLDVLINSSVFTLTENENNTFSEISKTIEKVDTNENQDTDISVNGPSNPQVNPTNTQLPSKFQGIRVFYRVMTENTETKEKSVQPTLTPEDSISFLDKVKNLNFLERSLIFAAVGTLFLLTLGVCVLIPFRNKKIQKLFSIKKGYSRVVDFSLVENRPNHNTNNHNTNNGNNNHSNNSNTRKDYIPINFKGSSIEISTPELSPLNLPVTAPIPPQQPPAHMHFSSEVDSFTSPILSPKRMSRK